MAEVVRGIYCSSKGTGPLHILSCRERGRWVCRCLEYDLVATDKSRDEALAQIKGMICRLFDATAGQLCAAPPAGPETWAAWNGQSTRHAAHLRRRPAMN